MNDNEDDKKPEEGAAAAPVEQDAVPVSDEAAAPETPAPVDAPSDEPVAEPDPVSDPAPAPEAEAEATPVAAMFEEPAPEPEATPEPEPEAPAKPKPWWSATRSAPPAAPAEPAEPVAAPAPESVTEPAEVAAAEAASEETPAAEPESEPEQSPDWVAQPFEQPDPGAGAEAAAAAIAAAALVNEEPEPEPETEPEPLPLRIYEYRFIRVKQNTWDSVEAAILGAGAAAVAEAGGQLYGVWAGQIGLSANQGIVVTVWTDLQSAKRKGGTAINGISDISASEALYMEPTTRPLDAAAPEGPGMFAHRVFEVRRDDADRFIELSTDAWPQFEEVFGTKIFALWRETGHERAYDRLILLTRYADYAAWEKSRYWQPEPNPNAADALQRFRERREITVDTVVYTTRLAVAAGE